MSLRHLLIRSPPSIASVCFLSIFPLFTPIQYKALAQEEDQAPVTTFVPETDEDEGSPPTLPPIPDVSCVDGDGCDQRKGINLENLGLKF